PAYARWRLLAVPDSTGTAATPARWRSFPIPRRSGADAFERARGVGGRVSIRLVTYGEAAAKIACPPEDIGRQSNVGEAALCFAEDHTAGAHRSHPTGHHFAELHDLAGRQRTASHEPAQRALRMRAQLRLLLLPRGGDHQVRRVEHPFVDFRAGAHGYYQGRTSQPRRLEDWRRRVGGGQDQAGVFGRGLGTAGGRYRHTKRDRCPFGEASPMLFVGAEQPHFLRRTYRANALQGDHAQAPTPEHAQAADAARPKLADT